MDPGLCQACGAVLEGGDRFCITCGRPVPAPAPTRAPEPAPPPTIVPAAPDSPRGRPSRRIVVIAAAAFTLVLAAVLVVALLPRRPAPLPGEALLPVEPATTGISTAAQGDHRHQAQEGEGQVGRRVAHPPA
ncbi:MAG: hypothetical protein V1750_01165 [Acidobacteriota bacterium]